MALSKLPRGFAGAFSAIVADLEACKTLANELKADLHQHTHAGVNAGAADSGAGPNITSPSISLISGSKLTGIPRTFASEFRKVVNDLTALATLANELKTDMHQHVHGGCTGGAANTGAGPSITSADIALKSDGKLSALPRFWAGELSAVVTDLTAIRTLLQELKTDLHQHVHGGVQAGGDDTGAGPDITSATISLETS